MASILLYIILAEALGCAGWYVAHGNWNQAMYWLGASLIQIAVIRGLQ